MEWSVEPNKTLDLVTDPAVIANRVPGLRQSLDAVRDLRQFYREAGHEGSLTKDWKHVASIRAPVLSIAELLDPEFLNGNHKKNFYRWASQHPEYITYDRRKALARKQMFGWRPDVQLKSTDQEAPGNGRP